MNPSDNGRQTNPSTQRGVTGIQAGRQPGPTLGDKSVQPCQASRLGDNKRQQEANEGNERARHPGGEIQYQRGVPGIHQQEANEGMSGEPSQAKKAVPGMQARAWQHASHF